jgi:penicillin-binding protein-related factor A (putative recombinase)
MMDKVGAKELEELVLFRARADEKQGLYTLGRYGVMSVFIKGQWQPIPSLPDFEGVTKDGRQFIFDTKTISQPSYDLSGGTHKSFAHQYKHLQRRAKFGVTSFLLMHWNQRVMKTKVDPAFTVAFPIKRSMFWDDYEAGSEKKITRAAAHEYGVEVLWDTATERSSKETPNILKTLMGLRNREE